MKAPSSLLLALTLLSAQAFSADKQSVRAEVGKPLQAAQAALQAKQYPQAQEQLDAAAKVAGLKPYEQYLIDRLRASAYLGQGNYTAALTAYDAVLTSPELPEAERAQTLESYARIAYTTKEYAKAADAILRYRAAGGSSTEVLALLPQAQYLAGDFAAASKELGQQIDTLEKAGKSPSEAQLQLLASCALKQNDMSAYTAALEVMVRHQPKPDYWLDLILRTAGKPGFSDKLDLDLYRLRKATGAMDKANDYAEAAQLALQAGYPGEAQQFIDAGYAAQLLGTGADAGRHQRLKEMVARKAAEDKATLADGEKAAATQAGGDALLSTGFNLVAYGQFERGLALMQQGLAKGGLKMPDQAKLHLGYAYTLAGSTEQALKAFETVQGSDGSRDLARLWSLHLKNAKAA